MLLDAAQLVEAGVEAVAGDAALAGVGGRAVDEGCGEARGHVGDGIDVRAQQLGGEHAVGDGSHRGHRGRRGVEAVAEVAQLPRRRLPQRGADGQALEVADVAERRAQRGAGAGVGDEEVHLVEAGADGVDVDERGQEAAPEQAGAGGRDGGVDDVEERSLPPPVRRAHELEMGLRGLVEGQGPAGIVASYPAHGQALARRAAGGEAEHPPRGPERERRVLLAGPREERLHHGLVDGALHVGGLERVVVAEHGPRHGHRDRGPHLPQARREEDLPRLRPRQLGQERAGVRHGGRGQLARGEIEERQAERSVAPGVRERAGDGHACVHRRQVEVGAGVELVALGHGARRHHPHDGPGDDALALARVGHLLADGHLLPLGEELRDVPRRRPVGEPRHGDGIGLVLVAARELEVQEAGGEDGVLVEHLVEVAHAEEEDGVGLDCLRLRVLPHERGDLPLAGSLHGARA